MLSDHKEVQHLASLFFNHKDIFFIGRGIDKEVVFLSDFSNSECPMCRECLPLCPSGTLYSLYLKGFSGKPETPPNKNI